MYQRKKEIDSRANCRPPVSAEEAKELAELMYTVPGTEAKKELSKNIILTLLYGKVATEVIDKIFKEIEAAGYATSDPDIIIRSVEAGLCGEETGSLAIGFAVGEHLKARKDHIARAKAIAEAQGAAKEESMAARGVKDLDPDKKSGEGEHEEGNQVDMEDERKDNTRGDGKSLKKGE